MPSCYTRVVEALQRLFQCSRVDVYLKVVRVDQIADICTQYKFIVCTALLTGVLQLVRQSRKDPVFFNKLKMLFAFRNAS